MAYDAADETLGSQDSNTKADWWPLDALLGQGGAEEPEVQASLAEAKRRRQAASPVGSTVNVYGQPLASCSQNGTALTGITWSGQCADMGSIDTGYHHICIEMTADFCEVTDQVAWCDDMFTCTGSQGLCKIGNWCAAAWAYATYLDKMGGCDASAKLVCEAINQAALDVYAKSSNPKHQAAGRCIKERCSVTSSSSGVTAAPSVEADNGTEAATTTTAVAAQAGGNGTTQTTTATTAASVAPTAGPAGNVDITTAPATTSSAVAPTTTAGAASGGSSTSAASVAATTAPAAASSSSSAATTAAAAASSSSSTAATTAAAATSSSSSAVPTMTTSKAPGAATTAIAASSSSSAAPTTTTSMVAATTAGTVKPAGAASSSTAAKTAPPTTTGRPTTSFDIASIMG